MWWFHVVWRVLSHPNLIRDYISIFWALPNFAFPRTHAEYSQWRKLFDHDPRFIELSDKLAMKAFFASGCPDLSPAPVLWRGTDPADIPDDFLEPGFVIKKNNGCRDNIFTRHTDLTRAEIEQKLRRALQKVYGFKDSEWSYSMVRPQLLVEPELGSDIPGPMIELNVFAFDGHPHNVFVIANKENGPYQYGVFRPDGTRITASVLSVPSTAQKLPQDFVLPARFDDAVRHAAELSQGFDHIRIDFMAKADQLWPCETTVYSASGWSNIFSDPDLTDEASQQWDLRKSWFLTTEHSGWRKRYAQALRRHLDRHHQTGFSSSQ